MSTPEVTENHEFEKITATLANVPLFKDLDEDMLAKLAGVITKKMAKAGERIISEGELGDELFILKMGLVKVVKTTLEKEEYTITTFTSDDNIFFGELALLDNETRSATVEALTDVELLVIHRDDFLKLGEEEPYLGLLITRELGKVVGRRLRSASQDIITLFEALVEEMSVEDEDRLFKES